MTLGELPVGTLVSDIDTKYKEETILWRIIGHRHEGDPDESTALLSEKIISFKAFDAKEPQNQDDIIKKYGNADYKLSNIFQWLNSDKKANKWYYPQHNTDQAPSESYVQYNPYDSQDGFLNGFSEQFKESLLVATKKVKSFAEDVVGKIHLLSPAEIGVPEVKVGTTAYDNYGIEGNTYKFFENNSFATNATKTAMSEYPFSDNVSSFWHLRSRRDSGENLYVQTTSDITYNPSYWIRGIRPLCFIECTNKVSDEPDENGVYNLFRNIPDEPTTPEEPDYPSYPMDGIWRAPKTDWIETDAFNLADYKRIRNNLLFLRNKMSDIWGEFSIQDMGNDQTDPKYIWKVKYFNAIEENLDIINQHSLIVKNYGYKQTFYQNGVFIGFSELNRIESATLRMKRIIDGWESGLRKLPFRLGAPKGLYL